MYAYREWGRKRGIDRPNIVLANTAHAAYYKACHYFNMEVRELMPDSKNHRFTGAIAKKAVDQNTVCIIGSAPSYCHAIIDDIASLSDLALKKKTNLHVDACLGGFVLPFA